jgi:uncharacterized protein (DUF433 family)
MTLLIESKPVPLQVNEEGVVLVTGTRVPLDTVIHAYQRGDSAKEIVEQFDVLKLADVHAIIAYYLDHQAEVDEYLHRREAEAEVVRRFIEEKFDQKSVRERLLARRQQNA